MSLIKLTAPIILLACLSLLSCASPNEGSSVTIVTPAPPPREALVMPSGYTGCYTVHSTWYRGVWYPEHRVCQYEPNRQPAAQGRAYVEAHWACTRYSTSYRNRGDCINWDWISGHWARNYDVYSSGPDLY